MVDLRQNAEARSILDRDGEYLLPVYARYPVVMERGEGVYLLDSSGNRYLDLMGGLGVNAVGHAHPRMVAAIADQAAKILHLSPKGAKTLDEAEPLARRAQERILAPLAPDDRETFMRMLSQLVELNNEASRAPLKLVATRSPDAA